MCSRVQLAVLALAAFAFGQAALGQEISAVHVHADAPRCEPPQRIVVQMPPPHVEVRAAPCSDESSRRCSIFGHKHREKRTHTGALGELLYAPVSLPLTVLPAPVTNPVFTQQFSHDFSTLQAAHEMELRAAALAARLAARNAMLAAEDDAMLSVMERSQKKMAALAGRVGTPRPLGEKEDGIPLARALQQLADRITRLEELVLQHQDAIRDLRGKSPAPPILPK
jgi:hypothetical protein